MTTRARLNRIFAFLFLLWGGALIGSGIAKGLPSADTAYGAGQLAAFFFGFLLVAVGGRTLVGLRRRVDAVGRRPPWLVAVAVPLGAVVLVAGGLGLWQHLRTSRADELAVKHGVVSSTGDVSLADRCTGVMHEEYERTDDPGKAGVPPKAYALLAPRVCALAVERGLVESDGTMSEQAGHDVTLAVIERLGVERFQTLVYDELAVSEYHLADEGGVTRWDRCVAMGYGGWDAQPSKESLPPRELFFRAVRKACTAGIARGIVPASGVAATDSRDGAAMQELLLATLLELSR